MNSRSPRSVSPSRVGPLTVDNLMDNLRLKIKDQVRFVMEELDLPCYDYREILYQKQFFFNEVFYPLVEYTDQYFKPVMNQFRWFQQRDYTIFVQALRQGVLTLSEIIPCYQALTVEQYRQLKERFVDNSAEVVLSVIEKNTKLSERYRLYSQAVKLPDTQDVVSLANRVFTKPLNNKEKEIFHRVRAQVENENKKYSQEFFNADEKFSQKQVNQRRSDESLALALRAVEEYRRDHRDPSPVDYQIKPTSLDRTKRLSLNRSRDLVDQYKNK